MPKVPFTQRSPFLIRLLNWEYWPANLVYIPVIFYYLWLSVKARSLLFFSASNPTIETGGMFGESKWEIFKLLPAGSFPTTILVKEATTWQQLLSQLDSNNLTFPLIAKPDRGERGWLVAKINNEQELQAYFDNTKVDFLLQTYIDLPVELSIFYYRLPTQQNGIISSMVVKEMLYVTGNGISTLRELIMSYPRALLQLPVLEQQLKDKMNTVPAIDEKIELVPYGNHSRGAKFIDAGNWIDDELTEAIDKLSKQIPGFHYGRYDLRCQSLEVLKKDTGFKILELNGAGAEPAHIYNPGFSLIKAYGVLFHHFKVMYVISESNHKKGVPYMTLREYFAMRRLLKNYRQKASRYVA